MQILILGSTYIALSTQLGGNLNENKKEQVFDF